jgi:hypothetical protein
MRGKLDSQWLTERLEEMSESLRGRSRKHAHSEEKESVITLEEVVGSDPVTPEDIESLQEKMIFHFKETPLVKNPVTVSKEPTMNHPIPQCLLRIQ